MKKLILILLFLPLLSKASAFVYDSTQTDFHVGNGTFGRALTWNDTIYVGPHTGGYNIAILDSLWSGGRFKYIYIIFRGGAFFKKQTSQSSNNFGTALAGIWVEGLHMLDSPECWIRLRAFNIRWPIDFIWKDCRFDASVPMIFDFTNAPYFLGDTSRMMHDWRFTNCNWDSTYNMLGDASGLLFGSPFDRSSREFYRDIEIDHCDFGFFPSPVDVGAGPGGSDIVHPSNCIAGDNVYNINIHDCTFHDLGVVNHPGGHTSAINLSIANIHVWNCRFGPNNFGDDIRMTGADLKGFPAYSGLSRVWNCITYRKRKYGFIEARYSDAGNPGTIVDTLAPYVLERSGPEVWHITGCIMGTGAGGNDFYSGAATLYDFYRQDSIILHNSVMVEIRDTVCNLSYFKAVDFALIGPYTLVDTSHLRVSCTWSDFKIDSVTFMPDATSQLVSAGETPPSWANTDINGVSRGSTPTIGAVQYTSGILPDNRGQVIPYKRALKGF